MTKFEQKKFYSILQILKQNKSDIVVRDNLIGRFCQHGVIHFQESQWRRARALVLEHPELSTMERGHQMDGGP